ncbi:hypothetical protein [Salibacterium halotolerans]|uniref:Uncharacterized protein n=1 Tax=Salibacterium halotolerans TaxID=1884432 RepID=A0A1I5XBJ7_9BACI|nr:hypothetical protein [Salibacterium halotolerans]SFQ29349.1 hypothetical protein SAMN05518683_12641 [Salibacterium halotolerans]
MREPSAFFIVYWMLFFLGLVPYIMIAGLGSNFSTAIVYTTVNSAGAVVIAVTAIKNKRLVLLSALLFLSPFLLLIIM